jgi:hypothetical protein
MALDDKSKTAGCCYSVSLKFARKALLELLATIPKLSCSYKIDLFFDSVSFSTSHRIQILKLIKYPF